MAAHVGTLDATMRAKAFSLPEGNTTDIHRRTSLKEFINLAYDPTVCGNLLDSKNIFGPVPGIISFVPPPPYRLIDPKCHQSRISDDCRAWELTHQLSYTHIPSKPSKERPRKSTVAPPKAAKTQDLAGPQVVRMDTWTMLRWNLMCHGGYVTYPHKDANGLCTWIYANVGVKIWAILEPRYFSSDTSRKGQMDLHCDIMGAPLSLTYDQASEMYTTVMAPGDIL
jgi:hypothetical protein